MEIRKRLPNDRKAKRFGKGEFIVKLITYDLYKKWGILNPVYKKKNKYKDYKKIVELIIGEISAEIVNNNLGVRLPFYNGNICVKYIDIMKKKIINDNLSNQVEKDVPHLNWNSSDKVAKIIWSISKDQRYNKMLNYFGFEPTREIRHLTYEKLIESPEIFKTNRN